VNALVEDVHARIVERGVPAEQQTMALDKVFWSHFCTNLAPATWVLGALLVGIGLDFRTGVLAILIGNVLGALPVGPELDDRAAHRTHADRDLALCVRPARNAPAVVA
jgi:hypothetical protein